MAVISGIGGSVSGLTYVGDVTQWSVTINAEAIDTTKMDAASSFRTKIGGIKSWSGSYTCLVDSTNVANAENDCGSSVAAVFNVGGGGANLSGNVIVTDVAVTATIDGAVEAAYTFEGTGALAFASD